MARLRNTLDDNSDVFGDAEKPIPPREQGQPPIPVDEGEGVSQPAGQAAEKPRERAVAEAGLGGNLAADIQSTPRRPSAPTPMTGSTFEPVQGVIPSPPMGGTPDVGMFTSRQRPLYGASGGLQGGGLGVALNPHSGAESDPISGLIQAILARQKAPGLF